MCQPTDIMFTQMNIRRSQPFHHQIDDNDKEESYRGTMPTTCPRRQGKSVSFKETATVRTTLALDSYSQEEIESTWYTSTDYSNIQKQCTKEIRMLMKGKIFRDKKYCARGLERFVKEPAAAAIAL